MYGTSAMAHSLCSWAKQGVLCEKVADAAHCSRWPGDPLWREHRRLAEFTRLCPVHCLKEPAPSYGRGLPSASDIARLQAQERPRRDEL